MGEKIKKAAETEAAKLETAQAEAQAEIEAARKEAGVKPAALEGKVQTLASGAIRQDF